MQEKKDIFDQIEAKSKPKLDDAYFQDMEAAILEKTINSVDTKEISIFRKSKFYIITGLAAAAILLLFLIPINIQEDTQSFAEINDDEIYNYIEENINDFEEETLLAFVDVENLDVQPIQQPASAETEIKTDVETLETINSNDLLDNINIEDLEEYINDQNTFLEEDDNELIELL